VAAAPACSSPRISATPAPRPPGGRRPPSAPRLPAPRPRTVSPSPASRVASATPPPPHPPAPTGPQSSCPRPQPRPSPVDPPATRLYPRPATLRLGGASKSPSARRSAAAAAASGAARSAAPPAAAEEAAGDLLSSAAAPAAGPPTNCSPPGSTDCPPAAAIAQSGPRCALCGQALAAPALPPRPPVELVAALAPRDLADWLVRQVATSTQMVLDAAGSGDSAAAPATAAGLRREDLDGVGLAAAPGAAARRTQMHLDQGGSSDRTVRAGRA